MCRADRGPPLDDGERPGGGVLASGRYGIAQPCGTGSHRVRRLRLLRKPASALRAEQRHSALANFFPRRIADTDDALQLNHYKVGFLIVDRRITTQLPRTGWYYEESEPGRREAEAAIAGPAPRGSSTAAPSSSECTTTATSWSTATCWRPANTSPGPDARPSSPPLAALEPGAAAHGRGDRLSLQRSPAGASERGDPGDPGADHRPERVILVVDHNDRLRERAQAEFGGRVDVIPNASRKGLSGARNTGVGAADEEVVAFLDDDAVPYPGWLESLISAYETGVLGVEGRSSPTGRRQGPAGSPPSSIGLSAARTGGCRRRRAPCGT